MIALESGRSVEAVRQGRQTCIFVPVNPHQDRFDTRQLVVDQHGYPRWVVGCKEELVVFDPLCYCGWNQQEIMLVKRTPLFPVQVLVSRIDRTDIRNDQDWSLSGADTHELFLASWIARYDPYRKVDDPFWSRPIELYTAWKISFQLIPSPFTNVMGKDIR